MGWGRVGEGEVVVVGASYLTDHTFRGLETCGR